MVHKLKSGLLFICCLLHLALPAAAIAATAPGGLDSFLGEIEAAAAKVRSLTCDFTQEKHLALFARPVVFQGTVNLVRPDRLRWEFTSPVPSVLIFRGESGIRCSGKAPPVRFDLKTDPVMQMVARQLWMWLDGNYTRLAAEYQLQLADADTLSLAPRNPKIAGFIAAINISFDQESKQPQQVEIIEPGGDLTRISFHDYQFDTDPDEALFSRCGDSE